MVYESDEEQLFEKENHQYLHCGGLEPLTHDEPDEARAFLSGSYYEENGFELWRLIKSRAESKIRSIHESTHYGEFIGFVLCSFNDLVLDRFEPMTNVHISLIESITHGIELFYGVPQIVRFA